MKKNLLLLLLLLLVLNVNAVKVRITTVSSTLNIRQDASVNSPVIGKIAFGESADFIGGTPQNTSQKDGVWYQIKYNGVQGWVKSDYLIFHFPARIVITTENPRLYNSRIFTNTDHFPVNTGKGDTLLVIDQGYAPMNLSVRTFQLDGGGLIAMDDCRYIGQADDSELSRYSHTPFTIHLKLLLIVILIIASLGRLFNGKYQWGVFYTVLTFAAEIWYLKTTNFSTWFVRPDIVGYIWTFINGTIFVIALLGQYLAVQLCFAYLGIGGIISDWGFRICLVLVLFNHQNVGLGLLVAPILFIINIIGNSRWPRIAYIFIGCIGWYWALVGFGQIIDTFHSFFVWTIVFFIWGSIPISSNVASKSKKETPNHVDIFHTADGTPYYNDSEGHMHTLNKDGFDSEGNMFDENGYKH
ncbi:MAG: SH3 domain-containing protein [Prevotella sp.]|nr:SH3 domain-containing protein [Prevotella sp.]